MNEELLVGVLAFAGVVITALAGLLVRERRRNGNPGHNPGEKMWEKLWNEHEQLEREIKSTRQVVRDGFTALDAKLDVNRRDIVDAINHQKQDVVNAINSIRR